MSYGLGVLGCYSAALFFCFIRGLFGLLNVFMCFVWDLYFDCCSLYFGCLMVIVAVVLPRLLLFRLALRFVGLAV